MREYTGSRRLNETLFVLATSISLRPATISIMDEGVASGKTVGNFIAKAKAEKYIQTRGWKNKKSNKDDRKEEKQGEEKSKVECEDKEIEEKETKEEGKGEDEKGGEEEKAKRKGKGKAKASTIEPAIRLKAEGKAFLEEADPDLYEFYRGLAGVKDKKIGNTESHIRNQLKAGDIHYELMRAGVSIGPEKPSAIAIRTGQAPKLSPDARVFYLNKEQKLLEEQYRIRTATTSAESSGLLISPGLTGFVYRVKSAGTRLNGRVEYQNNNLGVNFIRCVSNRQFKENNTKESLIIGDDYALLLEMANLHDPKRTLHTRKTFGDVFETHNITDSDFYYVPIGGRYTDLLKIATLYPHEELLKRLFTEEQIEAAKAKEGLPCPCDAYIETIDRNGDLRQILCYEFITGNISRLARIRHAYKNNDKINFNYLGFVCAEPQVPFLKAYFSPSYEIVKDVNQRERIIIPSNEGVIKNLRRLSMAKLRELFEIGEEDNV